MSHPKVDHAMVERAKAMRLKGEKQENIAVELGVSQGTVSLILRSSGMGGNLVRPPSAWSRLRALTASRR